MSGKKILWSNAFFLQELHLQGLWIPWRAPAGYHIRRDISLSIICSSICHIRRNVRMYIPHRFLPWGKGWLLFGTSNITNIYASKDNGNSLLTWRIKTKIILNVNIFCHSHFGKSWFLIMHCTLCIMHCMPERQRFTVYKNIYPFINNDMILKCRNNNRLHHRVFSTKSSKQLIHFVMRKLLWCSLL